MKRKYLFVILMTAISVFGTLAAQEKSSDFPILKGPYLGQKPPGKTPEIFAPGIVSTENHDAMYGFMNNVCIFDHSSTNKDNPEYNVYITELKNGQWTEPARTTFHSQPSTNDISLIPDENSILFGSFQSPDGIGRSSQGFNIWIVKMTSTGLSNARIYGSPLNSGKNDIYPSATKEGTIYFFSNRDDDYTNEDIYRARLSNGEYNHVERLGAPVNTENDEIDPLVAPDESYLIFCSKDREGYGGVDFYISFRTKDDRWTKPANMGIEINSPANDWMPHFSSDGKYLFFNSNRTGNGDVYWVDVKIIDDLKPDHLK